MILLLAATSNLLFFLTGKPFLVKVQPLIYWIPPNSSHHASPFLTFSAPQLIPAVPNWRMEELQILKKGDFGEKGLLFKTLQLSG